jgi:LPS export ABC transporter protein LptC
MRYLPLYIAVVLAFALMAGCSDKNEIKAPGVSASDGDSTGVLRPDTRIRGAQIFLYDGSVKTTDIRAEYIEKYEKQDSTLAWGLDVYFYNSDGEQASHLTSDSGLVREILNIMIANGSVVVVNEEGSRLETEQLNYNGNSEMITTDSFVTIYQPAGDTLRGYGMESDRELKRIRIKRQVSGSLRNLEDFDE